MKEINERTIKSASKVMLNSADMDMDVYLHIVELVIEDEKHNQITTFNENGIHFRKCKEDLKDLERNGVLIRESKTNGVDETMLVTCSKSKVLVDESTPITYTKP